MPYRTMQMADELANVKVRKAASAFTVTLPGRLSQNLYGRVSTELSNSTYQSHKPAPTTSSYSVGARPLSRSAVRLVKNTSPVEVSCAVEPCMTLCVTVCDRLCVTVL
ncbi:hypothetical protein BaRGS_00005630 [Batillaria attramentaria]|uniref:Uncharacterized protein n=1 Tax=Batillaria attramentaria TaxID=370345 RepID=A0ABD0LVF6_9CAEN